MHLSSVYAKKKREVSSSPILMAPDWGSLS
jgi:hypothetical protein